jgi:hypothetical protein
LQAKARTIEFEELTAQPHVEVVRAIVSVYRGGVEAAMPSAVLAQPLPEYEPEAAANGDASVVDRRE